MADIQKLEVTFNLYYNADGTYDSDRFDTTGISTSGNRISYDSSAGTLSVGTDATFPSASNGASGRNYFTVSNTGTTYNYQSIDSFSSRFKVNLRETHSTRTYHTREGTEHEDFNYRTRYSFAPKAANTSSEQYSDTFTLKFTHSDGLQLSEGQELYIYINVHQDAGYKEDNPQPKGYTYQAKLAEGLSFEDLNIPNKVTCKYNEDNKEFSGITFRKVNEYGVKQTFTIDATSVIEGTTNPSVLVGTDSSTLTGTDLRFTFQFSQFSSNSQNTVITFTDHDTGDVLEIITFIYNSSVTPVTPDDPNDPDTSGTAYSCIDYNTGTVVDSAELLYKGNSNNVYKTLTQKDNTLFLGNYKEVFNNTKFINELGANLGQVNAHDYYKGQEVEYTTYSSLYTNDNTAYGYSPNTRMNSQDRRIFKKGETYNLGLVFVTNTGMKSSVFYVGQYNPSIEPHTDDNNKLVKAAYRITIDTVNNYNVVNILNSSHIIGVIPVCAVNIQHRVKCQGIVSATVTSERRKKEENIDYMYSWYQRFHNLGSSIHTEDQTSEESHIQDAEVQCGLSQESGVQLADWQISPSVVTVNTPEIECSEDIVQSDFASVKGHVIKQIGLSDIGWIKNVSILYTDTYIHSHMLSPAFVTTYDGSNRDEFISRNPTNPIWYGFLDPGTEDEASTNFLSMTNQTGHYANFYVYPWQRNKLGGEKPESKITRKDFFDYMILGEGSYLTSSTEFTISGISVYRDYDTASIVRLNKLLYQGNMDYSLVISNPYYVKSTQGSPKAHAANEFKSTTYYAGYNGNGKSSDPITIRYKVAPHLVLQQTKGLFYDYSIPYIPIAELYDSNVSIDDSIQSLEQATWIKCGNIMPVNFQGNTVINFIEGDWFYGRYDSLRTYPYSEGETNNITEVVSSMLCSRVNLDLRTDRNRGIGTATISPTNFNRFNQVYNQANNYFTFNYIDTTQAANSRNFETSLQWSLTKVYGADTDNWCNIQSSNTLDLDGDKGQLICLTKNANNIVAFQETGISQILYNESVQIQSQNGVPIEIANSGKVQGKRYYTDNIGCQNIEAVTTALSGIYFIDGINKSLYLFNNGQIEDISTISGLKSWSLKNLDKDWWLYYDYYTQEVVCVNNSQCLAYSDSYRRFQSFLSYEGIKYRLVLNGRMYLFQNQISSGQIFRTWLKNGIDETMMFGKKKPLRVVILANPEPMLDKTFSNIEYRADCFDSDNNYLAWNTFNTMRIWDEYQDTGIVQLSSVGTRNKLDANGQAIYSNNIPSNLKKKFRIWRILIPRAIYGRQQETNINTSNNTIPDILAEISPMDIDYSNMVKSRDRIRNPWCVVDLRVSEDNDYTSMVIHDIMIQYFN